MKKKFRERSETISKDDIKVKIQKAQRKRLKKFHEKKKFRKRSETHSKGYIKLKIQKVK